MRRWQREGEGSESEKDKEGDGGKDKGENGGTRKGEGITEERWGESRGGVGRGRGSEERRWMRKEERGRKRGEIEEVHTENVGGKESETDRTTGES